VCVHARKGIRQTVLPAIEKCGKTTVPPRILAGTDRIIPGTELAAQTNDSGQADLADLHPVDVV